LSAAIDAFDNNMLGRPHLDKPSGKRLGQVSSLAFAGAQLDQGFLGCLLDDRIYKLQMPVSGVEPIHWHADISKITAEGEHV